MTRRILCVDGAGSKYVAVQWDGQYETGLIAQSLVMQPEVAAEMFRMRLPMSLIITDKHGVEFMIALGQWLMIKETGEIFKMLDGEFNDVFQPMIRTGQDYDQLDLPKLPIIESRAVPRSGQHAPGGRLPD